MYYSNQLKRISSAFLAACTVFVIAGCGTPGQVGSGTQSLPSRGGSPLSSLTPDETRTRVALQVARVPLPERFAYVPLRSCEFRQIAGALNRQAVQSAVQLSIRPVRDRLLIAMSENGAQSTLLIGPTGHVYDFNLIDQTNNQRTTPDNYSDSVGRQAAAARRLYGPTAHIVNPVSLMFPEFIPGRRNPGSILVNALNESRVVWASYVYAGLTVVNGNYAAVFDIFQVPESTPGSLPMVVGYDVVDLATMMPIVFVMRAGFSLRLDRAACVR